MNGPRIESAVANDLAAVSEEIADRLESGDRCGAAEAAARLRDGVTAAINEGKVPEVYLEDLSGLANELSFAVQPCAATPPPPPDEDDDNGRGKKKGKEKKRNKNDKDADTVPTVTETRPEETTTEETTTQETTTQETTTTTETETTG